MDTSDPVPVVVSSSNETGDAIQRALDEWNRHMERELRGAWMAGYDYVHMFEGPEAGTLAWDDNPTDSFVLTQYLHPSNSEHPPEPEGVRYAHTYCLASVPDKYIKRALDGGVMIPADMGTD